MQPQPDVIVIEASHEDEIGADRADLRVTVRGSSLVTGNTALRKAKEVRHLIERLLECGLDEADIELEGVQAQVASGLLGRSSSAVYRLRVRCSELELLPDVLGAVTSAKNAVLEAVSWHYPESAEQQAEWIRRCVARANLKAEAAAQALGTRLCGVHRFSEHRLESPLPMPQPALAADMEMVRARKSGPPSLAMGFDLTHRKKTGIRIEVAYRVEGFEPPRPPESPRSD